MEELRGLYDSDTPVLAYDFKKADGGGLDAGAQSPPRATRRTDAGFAHRGNRKRTMDVSLPTLRMDSTQL